MHRQFSHEITIDHPPETAIHLFTPKGEEAWVPGWQPEYITPSSGETTVEMVFITREIDEMTYWTCLQWHPDEGHARYFRLTPNARAAFVDVQCRPGGHNTTLVRVAYELHSLSQSGMDYVEGMTQTSFNTMIEEWAALIHASGACASSKARR